MLFRSTGSDLYTITRNTLLTDDFAQAVNIGAAALWHVNDAWPNFAVLAGVMAMAQQQVAKEVIPDDDWADDPIGDRYFSM